MVSLISASNVVPGAREEGTAVPDIVAFIPALLVKPYLNYPTCISPLG